MKMAEKLNLPAAPPDFLDLQYLSTEKLDTKELEENIQNGCTQPFAASDTFLAFISSAQQLTQGEDVKKVVDICLNIQDGNIEFHPGDTIGVIPQNPEKEVEEILRHLKILEKADLPVNITVKPGTLKKKASVPSHIPAKTTLRHIFLTCVDIRAVPKKFPSCCPPVERLLEHLSRLQNNKELHIVYSLLEDPSKRGTGLNFGVCTGWLDSLTKSIQTIKFPHDPLLEDMSKLSLKTDSIDLKIPIYLRKSSGFTLPKDPTIPIILIGPGTGVAPYIGFLQHRSLEKHKFKEFVFGETWLFFGCRYKERDYLYRSELEKFVHDGTLSRLFLSCSREEGNNFPRYVQDNIRLHGKEFLKQVFEKNATIYVCGDAKNMGKDILKYIYIKMKNNSLLITM
ncbi:Methionine synthase reductase [Blattella germanica]|nr:Methionine synthase reductase [Blattella germanica]